MSLEEFGECTPRMFQALCSRRIIQIKYQRHAAAIAAAAVYNVNRCDDSIPVVNASDWIMDREQAERKENQRAIRKYIRESIMGFKFGTPRSKFLEARRKAINYMKAQDVKNAEQMFDELWPTLKPQEGEE